LRRFRYL